MTEEEQIQLVGWEKTNPLLHLVTAVRADELGLPVVESEYGREDCLFGWVVSEESLQAMNVWTKRFKDWYEKDTGDMLIDHEIEPVYLALENEAVAAYARYKDGGLSGAGEKEVILFRIHQLRGIAKVVADLFQNEAEQLAEKISRASACENEEHKEQYRRELDKLTNEVRGDLERYCSC